MTLATKPAGSSLPPSEEAQLHILRNENATLTEAFRGLEGENTQLRERVGALEGMISDLQGKHNTLVSESKDLVEYAQAAEKTVAYLHEQVESYKKTLSEESRSADAVSKREKAAVEIMEAQLQELHKSALLCEEIGARYTALESLTENTVALCKAMIVEGSKQQLLQSVDEALQPVFKEHLDECVTVPQLNAKFQSLMQLTESVAQVRGPQTLALPPAPPAAQRVQTRPASVQEAREPLPTRQNIAAARRPAARQAITEAASLQPASNREALAIQRAEAMAQMFGERPQTVPVRGA